MSASRTCHSDSPKVIAYSLGPEPWAKTKCFSPKLLLIKVFHHSNRNESRKPSFTSLPPPPHLHVPGSPDHKQKSPFPILSWFPHPHVGSFASSSLHSTPPNVFTVPSSSQCPRMLACTWGISPSLKYLTIDLACLYCLWTIFSWSLQFPSLPAAVINSRISISPYWIERSLMQYPSSSKSIYTSEQNRKS